MCLPEPDMFYSLFMLLWSFKNISFILQGPVTAVNFSRTGEFFASGGADEQVI